MDVAIATIIITAFINVIITSIVSNMIFYRYQKRIESSFVTSLFEHQTKFVRSYEKSVETLEMLNKKYISFSDTLSSLIMMGGRISVEDNLNVIGKLDDFWKCFKDNRLFLPENIVDEIWNVYEKSLSIVSISTALSSYFVENTELTSMPEWVIALTKNLGLRDDWFDLENPRPSIGAFILRLHVHTKTLERLYRMVAETKQ